MTSFIVDKDGNQIDASTVTSNKNILEMKVFLSYN